MTELHLLNPIQPSLAKYTRKHFLDLFDALHQKSGFEHQSINDYPERTIPRSLQYKKRPKVDINEDSDATTGESDVDGSDVENDGQDVAQDEIATTMYEYDQDDVALETDHDGEAQRDGGAHDDE